MKADIFTLAQKLIPPETMEDLKALDQEQIFREMTPQEQRVANLPLMKFLLDGLGVPEKSNPEKSNPEKSNPEKGNPVA